MKGVVKRNKKMPTSFKPKGVKVGILDAIPYPKKVGRSINPITILEVGRAHEFGIGKLPKRSFLEATLLEKEGEMKAIIAKQYKLFLAGKISDVEALSRVGLRFRMYILEAFGTGGFGQWPDIQEATKARKGSDKILIEDGDLKGSIHEAVY